MIPALLVLLVGEIAPSHPAPIGVDLFVMSECPYGVAAEVEILEALSRLSVPAELRLHFIARDRGPEPGSGVGDGGQESRPPGGTPSGGRSGTSGEPRIPDLTGAGDRCEDADGTRDEPAVPPDARGRFSSLHGPSEVREDARQVVLARRWPRALPTYLGRRAENYDDPDGYVSAAEAAGVDPDSLDALAGSSAGADWLAVNVAEARARGIRASPTLMIGGAEYRGPLRAVPLAYALGAAQGSLGEHPLPECLDDEDCLQSGAESRCEGMGRPDARCVTLPPVPVAMTVLVDSLCAVCPESFLVARAREVFPGLVPTFLDASGDPGRRLAAQLEIAETPVLVFDEGAKAAPRWDSFRRRLRPAAGRFVFDARALDTTSYPGRALSPGRLDVFVAGRHRESLRALRAVGRLQDHSAAEIDVRIRFVAESDTASPWVETFALAPDSSGAMTLRPAGREPRFTSFRGASEIEEDRRLLCLLHVRPDRFERYIDRTLAVTDSAGLLPEPWSILLRMREEDPTIDLAALDACVRDPASAWELLESASLAESLGVTVTPSFLMENRVRLTGLTYETLQALIDGLRLGIELPSFEDLMRRRARTPPSPNPTQDPKEGH